jgi:alpha-glucosidase
MDKVPTEKEGSSTDNISSRTDIDWMLRYRDFENDPEGFDDESSKGFIQRLHDSGRHYVPIIDSAIYIPNPSNPDDA